MGERDHPEHRQAGGRDQPTGRQRPSTDASRRTAEGAKRSGEQCSREHRHGQEGQVQEDQKAQ
jgi:hypothetical protein